MPQPRFDDLPRALAATTSRRTALKALAGAALVGAALPATRPVIAQGDIARGPFLARAIYMNPKITDAGPGLQRLVDLIDRTELNALVVDIKEDGVYFDTEVPLFREAGAVRPLYDPAPLLQTLREHGIYTIARLVAFKDTLVAEARPDLAVKDVTTGGPWRDMNGVAWVNTFSPELWEANASLALEAAQLGFDEIQYDYVRFPTDGDLSTMDFGQPYTAEARTNAIVDFLTLTREKLAPTRARLAADLFGYTLVVDDDLGIGQNAARLAPLLDYVCPMVYPSHWPEGSLGIPGHPNDFPYETVAISMEAGTAKVAGQSRKLRPWLQDFSLPGLTAYDAADVRAQIDAAEAAKTGGWMLWDPTNVYHAAALKPAQ